MLPTLLQTHLALTVETDPRRLGYLRARMLGLVPPCWWRLAGEVLELAANGGQGAFTLPDWFPVAHREPLGVAMEAYGVGEGMTVEGLAGFFAAVLDEVGREE